MKQYYGGGLGHILQPWYCRELSAIGYGYFIVGINEWRAESSGNGFNFVAIDVSVLIVRLC